MMKRIGYLFEQFEDKEFIRRAIVSAAEHKHNRRDVQYVLKDLPWHVNELQRILPDEAYKPSPIRERQQWDPRSKKWRTITAPRFWPDQCVQWALVLAIRPVLMRGMYKWSVGNIPGRGRIVGVKYVQKVLRTHARRTTKWCLKMDVRHFYQSINKDALMEMLGRKIKDARMMKLISVIVYSYDKGLPLGNYTSQWLANFYLEGFDHYVKEKLGVRFYIRNVDDLVVIGTSKRKLHKVRRAISDYLADIDLELKGNWQVFRVYDRGIDFLGYVMYHDKTRLRDYNFLRLARQARRMAHKIRDGDYISPRFAMGLMSRIGQLKWCGSYALHEHYIAKGTIKTLRGIIRRWTLLQLTKQQNQTATGCFCA